MTGQMRIVATQTFTTKNLTGTSDRHGNANRKNWGNAVIKRWYFPA
jgi:hypothetical protein